MFDTFYWDMRDVFSEKLMTEIFKSKHLSICNVADSFYAVFPHAKTSDGQCAVVINADTARCIVDDPSSFGRMYSELSDEQKEQITFVVGKATKPLLQQWKANTNLNGPSSDIDIEFEQQLGVRQNDIKQGRMLR